MKLITPYKIPIFACFFDSLLIFAFLQKSLLIVSSTEQFFESVLYFKSNRWWATNWWSPTFSRSRASRLTSSMPWLSLMTPDSMTELAILSWLRAEIITVPMICSTNGCFSDPHICFSSSAGIWLRWYYGFVHMDFDVALLFIIAVRLSW